MKFRYFHHATLSIVIALVSVETLEFVEDLNLCLAGFPASGVLEYGRAKEKVLGLRLIIRGSDTKAKLKI